MRPTFPFLIAAALFWAGALAGCLGEAASTDPPVTDPEDPPPQIIDTTTRTWILPYPPGTPDSELVGDFAPVAEGNTWTYHQSRKRSLSYDPFSAPTTVDTEWIAKVDVRIVSVEPSDTGRLIRVRVEETPHAVRCLEAVHGKTWRWEEPPRDSAQITETLYLEKGDAFFQFGPAGKWQRAIGSYGMLYHRFEKARTFLDPDLPWRDTLALAAGSGDLLYLKDVGLVRMYYREETSYGSRGILANLVSFNDRILLDSLDQDLRRPLVPKDPRTGIVTLEVVGASLPAGYCDEPGPPKAGDPDQTLYDWVDIVPGKTWEYLASERSSSSAAWYQSGSTDYQGLSRMTVTDTLASGGCTIFGWRETDSLFQGESTVWDGVKQTQSTLPTKLASASGFGVKRGQGVYRWSQKGESGSLDSLDAGLDQYGVLWPFVSGQAGIAVGARDSIGYTVTRDLSYSDPGARTRLVYTFQRKHSAPLPEMEYRFVKGTGIVFSQIDVRMIGMNISMLRKLELFRLDGVVMDDQIFSRYQALKPGLPKP